MRLSPLALLLLAGCASEPLTQSTPSFASAAPVNASAESLHTQGLNHLSAGRLTEAESAFTQTLQSDPGLAQAYRDRGRARVRLGNLDGARQDLDRWLEYDPKYALVRADWDLLLFRDTEREAKLRQEEAAAKVAEDGGSLLAAFRHYAAAYALSDEAKEGPLADALVRTWKAAKTRPGYPPALRGFLARGQAAARDRRHEEAAVAYRQAARFCPWCAEANYNLAVILGEYQQYAEAKTALKRAVDLLPEGPEAQEASGTLITWEALE